MSTYSETQDPRFLVIDVLVEMAKSPDTYKDYAEKTVEEVLKELAKGETTWEVDPNDPLSDGYYTVVQNHTMDEEAKAIARMIKDFDESELAKAGLKVEGNQQLLLYRLYEVSCNEQVDIKNISVDDFKILTKYTDWIGKVGFVADVAEYAGYAGNMLSALIDGNIKGVWDEVAKWIGSAASGLIAKQLAGALITALAVSNPLVAFATFAVFGMIGSAIGDEVADGWKMIFDEIFGLYDQAGAYTYPVDPLILDLDCDGIETVSVEDGVNFDFDNNGFAEKTGWVGADDGLLVRDIDGNGQIDNGSELFGDMTSMEEAVASHGFEALQQFDTNQDNVINQMDAIYSELSVWKDANQNGQVDEGELLTLEELGIAGLNLVYEDIEVRDENGNSHSQASTYMNTDGSIGIMEDVWFAKVASDTVVDSTLDDTVLAETEAIGKLPDIMGRGNQYSLHQAMLRDETGTLQQMVEAYIAEEDEKARKAMIPDIVYVWTGVADVASGSRGVYIDARKLEALEVISGREFESTYGENPVRGAGKLLNRAFDNLVDMYYALLEQQTTFADLYTNLYLNFDVDEDANLFFDTQELAQSLTEGYRADNWSNKKMAVHFIDNLMKTGMIRYVKEEVFYQ